MAREAKNLRATTKIFSRHVFCCHIPVFSRTTKEKRCLCAIGYFGHVADASSSRPKMPTFGAVVKTKYQYLTKRIQR
ncbi:DUF1661 domain-containing protein [Porphyromonas gulae]|uniref:DUF1661 domain-containing protein n=1 Tax=Porphyromonas gulae TaxID=111105 RepID=UPI0026F184DE|nr:DUF1661 domain-containing protein [Porphyromonas gulae]